MVTTAQDALKLPLDKFDPDAATDRFHVATVDNETLAPFAPGVCGFKVQQRFGGYGALRIGCKGGRRIPRIQPRVTAARRPSPA